MIQILYHMVIFSKTVVTVKSNVGEDVEKN